MKISKVFLLVSLVFLLSGCQEKTLEVGFSGSLTGNGSELGVAARNGFNLAIDEINEDGGINGHILVPIIKDDESNIDTAKKIGQSFIDENVNYVIGFLTSNMTPAIEETMSKSNILFISPTISTPQMSNIDDQFLRVMEANDHQAIALAELSFDYEKIDNIAVVIDDSNARYTRPIHELFEKTFVGKGGNIKFFKAFESENLDASALADEIKASGSKGIVLVANSIDSANILQQLYKIDYKIPSFLAGWANTNDFIYHGGLAAEGAYTSSVFDADSDKPKYLDFVKRYQNKYGEEPSFSSHFAYDSLMMLTKGMESSNSFDPVDIKNEIIKIRDFEGIQSSFTINEFGDVIRENFRYRVENGTFNEIDY
ncbi:MAG: ABC transporter substrate-binding protein [Tissierellales bacterium]|nr:ABC transporter substrate-binding protein [Tissierellales bacterium]